MNNIKFIRDELVKKYNEIKNSKTDNVVIETEFRFTLFSKMRNGYYAPSSGVDIATYLRIKNHYNGINIRSETSLTTNYTQNIGQVRLRKTIEDNKVSWLKKERDYLNYLFENYYVQTDIKKERKNKVIS